MAGLGRSRSCSRSRSRSTPSSSGGLLAPWIAHVLTDVAVAAIVLTLARG
jgi:hypothetical protein